MARSERTRREAPRSRSGWCRPPSACLVALERDQRRLRAHAKGLPRVLLAIEHHEIHEILEFRRGHQLAQDRVLGLAGWTPGEGEPDEDRLTGLLRLGERFRIEGFGLGGQRRHRTRRWRGTAAKTRVRRDSNGQLSAWQRISTAGGDDPQSQVAVSTIKIPVIGGLTAPRTPRNPHIWRYEGPKPSSRDPGHGGGRDDGRDLGRRSGAGDPPTFLRCYRPSAAERGYP